MTRKVKVALFDKDLRTEIKTYPLNSDGTKLEINPTGGKGYFMPEIDTDTYLDIKRPWYTGGGYQRVYFVMKWAKECVNFKTGDVKGPDPKVVMDAASAQILKNKAEDAQAVHWSVWIMLGLLALIFLKVFGVLA